MQAISGTPKSNKGFWEAASHSVKVEDDQEQEEFASSCADNSSDSSDQVRVLTPKKAVSKRTTGPSLRSRSLRKSSKGQKKRRKTPKQQTQLRNYFKANVEWDHSTITRLAHETGLTKTQVYKWYWDQKAKILKRVKRITPIESKAGLHNKKPARETGKTENRCEPTGNGKTVVEAKKNKGCLSRHEDDLYECSKAIAPNQWCESRLRLLLT